MKFSSQIVTAASVVVLTIPSTQAKFGHNIQSFFRNGLRGGGGGGNGGGQTNGAGQTNQQQYGGWGEQQQHYNGWGQQHQHQDGWGEGDGDCCGGMGGCGGGMGVDGWCGGGGEGLLLRQFFPLDDFKTITLNCSNTEYDPSELACYNPRSSGVNGTWACRTLYHPFTGSPVKRTVCIDTTEEVWNIDECGCCDGDCPEACQCSCTYGQDNEEEGVLVQFGLGQQHCVPVEYSPGLVASHYNASCVVNCPP